MISRLIISTMAILIPVGAQAEWFAVRNGNDGCSSSLTPGAMLRLADATGSRSSYRERKDAQGNITSVTVTIDQGGVDVTAVFFASEEDCLASIPTSRAIPKAFD